MGGAQSASYLGDALWTQERQKQRMQRESSSQYETHQNGQHSQDRRKLLKKTKSLAVISEDFTKSERHNQKYHFGDSNCSIPRRAQLIPRAKLIDRNSLKDRLSKSQQHLSEVQDKYQEGKSYHSHSTHDLYSQPQGLPYFEEASIYSRSENHLLSERLNILDWPRAPRRYRSHQDLDSVSGLVDIVENNWSLNDNQNCNIYTQVKVERNEHPSLDSILFEDEGELEYFDVLNLFPKVRLEVDETDSRNNSKRELIEVTNNEILRSREVEEESIEQFVRQQTTPQVLQVSEYSDDNQNNSLQFDSNVTDEEKFKSHLIKEEDNNKIYGKIHTDEESWKSFISLSSQGVCDSNSPRESFQTAKEDSEQVEKNINEDKNSDIYSISDIENSLTLELQSDLIVTEDQNNIEEAEDFKTIWVSDTEEVEDMSRRPQVLKIIDNDVTKRRSRGNVVEIDVVARDILQPKNQDEVQSEDEVMESALEFKVEEEKQKDGIGQGEHLSIENAKNFFEAKSNKTELIKSQKNEGRFEKIVKETSNIIGKACNAVKGTLGFDARSESSDLGLGSDCESDRRRSIDDGVDDVVGEMNCIHKENDDVNINDNDDYYSKPGKTNLTRSRSCVDSIECQNIDNQEFNHIRYKIVKSRLFGKNIFGNIPSKGDAGYDGLMQYLKDYSFQELLLDNNVVIIEPVRAEQVEIKSSLTRNNSKCTTASPRIAAINRKEKEEEKNQNDNKSDSTSVKEPKQSTLRKHFFYHPISSVNRVNRELIDEELPDPDTVRNVRKMFEASLRPKNSPDYNTRKSVSMKDLSEIREQQLDNVNEPSFKASRSRHPSRAKDLTRLFEGLDKKNIGSNISDGEDSSNNKNESKTKILAQSFEERSGNTSPTDSGCARNKVIHYRQQNNTHHHRQRQQQNNWDAGSVSSGVSSDYPDTDHGSGMPCTSSEDEEIDSRGDDDEMRNPDHSHFVSQDVLKKIREYGTSVTYYGGKVVNSSNGPLISPLNCNIHNPNHRDYVKFQLVKSNSCDSRLELTGKVIERRSRLEANDVLFNSVTKRKLDLRTPTIAETPSIEITSIDSLKLNDDEIENNDENIVKREPPVIIGLEPKKEDGNRESNFKVDFILGKLDNKPNKFASALKKWQVNESDWNKKNSEFGKMEFEEFEVLEDSLNGAENSVKVNK